MSALKIAILGSTRGTNLVPIVEAVRAGQLDADIVVVLSNKIDAGILEKAKAFGLKTVALVPQAGEDRYDFDQRVLQILRDLSVDLVVLVGYMRILSAAFVKAYLGKIINVHPSLLPKHKGLMDLSVHQAVIDQKDVESGCSVHVVTEEVDGGQILVQKQCPVYTEDDALSLKARVQALEGVALIEAIQQFIHKDNT